MTGGGSLLRNIDRVLADETGLPVRVAEGATDLSRSGQAAFSKTPSSGKLFVRPERPETGTGRKEMATAWVPGT